MCYTAVWAWSKKPVFILCVCVCMDTKPNCVPKLHNGTTLKREILNFYFNPLSSLKFNTKLRQEGRQYPSGVISQ